MNVSPGGGGVVNMDQITPSTYPSTFTLNEGESINLEAMPTPGYRFDNWSGALSHSANPVTIVMDCNKSITANFTPDITVKANWPLVGGILGGLMLEALLFVFTRPRDTERSGPHNRTSLLRLRRRKR